MSEKPLVPIDWNENLKSSWELPNTLFAKVRQWIWNNFVGIFSKTKKTTQEVEVWRRNALVTAADFWATMIAPRSSIETLVNETPDSLLWKLNLEVVEEVVWQEVFNIITGSFNRIDKILLGNSTREKLSSQEPKKIFLTIYWLVDDMSASLYVSKLIPDNEEGENWATTWANARREQINKLIYSQTNWEAFWDFSSLSYEEAKIILPFLPEQYLQKLINSQEKISLKDLEIFDTCFPEIILPEGIVDRWHFSIYQHDRELHWKITTNFPHDSNIRTLLNHPLVSQTYELDLHLKIFSIYDKDIMENAGKLIDRIINYPFTSVNDYIGAIFSVLSKFQNEWREIEAILDKFEKEWVWLPKGIWEIVKSGENRDMFCIQNMPQFTSSYQNFKTKYRYKIKK